VIIILVYTESAMDDTVTICNDGENLSASTTIPHSQNK